MPSSIDRGHFAILRSCFHPALSGIRWAPVIRLISIDQFIEETLMQFNSIVLAHLVTAITTDAFILINNRDFIYHDGIPRAGFFAGSACSAF
jgi:hypothetical protein